MTNLKRIAIAVATGSVFLLTTGVASADTLVIKKNGQGSKNSIGVMESNTSVVNQASMTNAMFAIGSSANTGDNTVSKNNGGKNSVDTGSAKSEVTVSVRGGSNTATAPDPCGCDGEDTIVIKKNAQRSKNKVRKMSMETSVVNQASMTNAMGLIGSQATTGGNRVRKNNGKKNRVKTGKARSTVKTTVTGGSNTLLPEVL